MASRSLNQVQLIGNLTRDPELRYTPNSTAVCTFSIATNRQWTTENGERKEDVEFHRIVAWQKLAEICGKYLIKGKQVYVKGRLQTRSWKGQDGNDRQTTEIVIDEMIMLGSAGRSDDSGSTDKSYSKVKSKSEPVKVKEEQKKDLDKKDKSESNNETNDMSEDVPPDDIPF
jgi:single-strand DNA-binding protein